MLKRQRLNEILFEQGRKKAWLARQLGIDPVTLKRYLTGTSEPKKATVMAASMFLNVPLGDLWDQSDSR